jgi:hypothetical protein
MKLLQWSDSPVDSWLIHGSRLSQETGWRFGWSEAGWEAWEEFTSDFILISNHGLTAMQPCAFPGRARPSGAK